MLRTLTWTVASRPRMNALVMPFVQHARRFSLFRREGTENNHVFVPGNLLDAFLDDENAAAAAAAAEEAPEKKTKKGAAAKGKAAAKTSAEEEKPRVVPSLRPTNVLEINRVHFVPKMRPHDAYGPTVHVELEGDEDEDFWSFLDSGGEVDVRADDEVEQADSALVRYYRTSTGE